MTLIEWVEMSDQPSVRPSVKILGFFCPLSYYMSWIFEVLRLHGMILDMGPHNPSVRFLGFTVTWPKNEVKMPYGIYLFLLITEPNISKLRMMIPDIGSHNR